MTYFFQRIDKDFVNLLCFTRCSYMKNTKPFANTYLVIRALIVIQKAANTGNRLVLGICLFIRCTWNPGFDETGLKKAAQVADRCEFGSLFWCLLGS